MIVALEQLFILIRGIDSKIDAMAQTVEQQNRQMIQSIQACEDSINDIIDHLTP